MMKRVVALLRHWREAKSAFSTLGFLYSDDSDALDALGGLTDEEMRGLIGWLPERGTLVEVGTLFGITALAVKRARPELRVVAVDNFSWNPFGLPSRVHEQFTRRILEGSGVEIVKCSSEEWRQDVQDIDAVFFDASHAYEDVKSECEWAKSRGIPLVMGHDYGNPNPRFGVTRAVDGVFGKERVRAVGMCWCVRT